MIFVENESVELKEIVTDEIKKRNFSLCKL